MKTCGWRLLLALVCLSSGAVSAHATPPAKSSRAVTVGVVLTLSGEGASFGQRMLRGIELAQGEPSPPGAAIMLKVEDSAGKPAGAVTAARKLIDFEHVHIILGDARSDCVLSMAPVTEQKKIILFTSVAGAEAISDAGDFVFRNQEGNLAHGTAVARYLREQGLSRAAVFTAQASNAATFGRGFTAEFTARGGAVVSVLEYLPATTDFQSLIAKALTSKPEAVYVAPTLGTDAGLLVKQLRAVGYQGVLAGGLPVESPEFLTAAEGAAEGLILSSPAFDEDAPAVRSFRERFRKAYGADADWISAYAYDSMELVKLGVERCGGDSAECVRDFLYATKNYPGIGGLTSFDSRGDVSKPLIIKRVTGGTFKKISAAS